MTTTYSTTTTGRTGFAVSSLFVPFPFVCFTLTLFTDIIYWQTSFLMWQNFSSWLLLAGLVGGGFGLLAGAIDMARRATRMVGPGWAAAVAYIVVLALAFLNSLIHANDGWPAVVPNGLIVSTLTVATVLVTVLLAARNRSRVIWSVER